MPKTLSLHIELAGCPTVCEHCWAQGKPYKPMPLEDIAWVLEQAQRFAVRANLNFNAYPFHEALAHPDASKMLRLFKPICEEFQPFTTDGIPLAIRDDWEELLQTVHSLETSTFWVHFHGLGEVHDQTVHRAGAYKETCLAVKRIRSMGFQCGCNVFVHKRNLHQLDSLANDLQQVGITEMNWSVSNYQATARGRRYESLRPELGELLPHANRVHRLSRFSKDKWANLQAYTESAYIKQILENNGGNQQDSIAKSRNYNLDYIKLVCRNNLDFHSGVAGLYGHFHGNLRTDGPDIVLQKAVEYVPCEPFLFSVDRLPAPGKMAEKVGNLKGQKIYFSFDEMYLRWLDLALAKHRRY